MEEIQDFVLVCSVGGSPEPIRKSINQQRPRHIIYIASAESRKTIRQGIESALDWHGIEDSHTVTLSDYQDLLACVRDMRAGIADGLRGMGLPEDSLLIADITGGTKVMSSALTLVMMEYRSRFAYVGGDTRSKNGLGVVESGHETFMKQDNPWEVMALREVRSLARFFNAGDFTAALTIARELTVKVSGKEKFYGGIAELMEGCALWDAFDHGKALSKLRQALGRLEAFALGHTPLFDLLTDFRNQQTRLEQIVQDARFLRSSTETPPADCGGAYLCDLLANAARRAGAGRYDDAVARLYSAIEKSAKIRLMTAHGLDNSRLLPEQLPEHVPQELRQDLLSQQGEDGIIRIGLQKSFQLLAALDDPLGQVYSRHETVLLKTLEARNGSLLAHGYTPVSVEACRKLMDITLTMLGLHQDDLPHFPVLNWKSLLL